MNTNKILISALSMGFAALLWACPSGPKSGIQPIKGPAEDIVPDEAGTTTPAPVFPKEEFRAKQPDASAPRAFNLPGINQFKLGNQIDVYLVERHELPTISMELNFDGGSVTDRNGREGTASLCMSMLSRGTKKLEKLAFDEALADIASSVSSYAGAETQGVSMRTLKKNLDATLALFGDTLLQPGLRDAELDRVVKRSLESLKQAKGSPGSVAGRVISGTIYGQKHPFGKIITETSLAAIKINDCKSYHKSYIKPAGARLFVVGDMTQKEVTDKLAPLLNKWKGSPKKIGKVPKPKSRNGRVFFVDIPGAAQSSIYVAHMGPNRTDKEFYANQMMAGVLGGGFTSRINMNLREDKGYSYGARGTFSYNRHFGTFMARSSVRSNATRQSLQEIFDEMDQFKSGKRPANAEELEREQNGAILGLPARFATAGQVLSMYRRLVYYGLPMSYYNEYVANFSSVNLAQVNATAGKLLHPEDAIVLVVGDGAATQIVRGEDNKDIETELSLTETLKELAASEIGGKGALVTLDADGIVQRGK